TERRTRRYGSWAAVQSVAGGAPWAKIEIPPEGSPMARESLVAVSYPVDDEFTRINTGVLDGAARVVFLHGRPEEEFREVARQANVLIGWHLGEELPAGILNDSPRPQ